MKKCTKLGLGAMTLLLGSIVLSGCTASFCNNKDQAHMLYAFEYGVTTYYDSQVEGSKELVLHDDVAAKVTFDHKIYVKISYDDAYGINAADKTASTTNNNKSVIYSCPSLNYWEEMDRIVLAKAIEASGVTKINSAVEITRGWNYEEGTEKGILDNYGYLKFYGNEDTLWGNWIENDQKIRLEGNVSIDECPTTDYVSVYKTTLNNYIVNNRSCITTSTNDYGYYGPHQSPVEIENKTWASSFAKTNFLWLEGILVWPMGAFIDVLTSGMLGAGIASGWAQFLAIVIITFIVRAIMLLITWKQTTSTAKMNELQPQIAKIQAKYPNANTNRYEKERMASEMGALYKKNKINPISSLLPLLIQFPVFLCVWAALQGSAILSSGAFLNLNFSQSISSVLFNASEWNIAAGGGALTALLLFLLMAAGQIMSMLLPQILQKIKAKKIAKLGNNPNQKSQDNKMKWFTIIMCAMIIFMGFSLASGLIIYWIVGAVFSVAQTLIMNTINNAKAKKKR